MDLRHITAFVATYEEGSINRAAQRMNLAQPSVSSILRDLEAEMGTTLLERASRGAHPTAAGETFYRHCLKVLAEVDAARNSVMNGVGRVAGPIRIGLAPTVAKGLMPLFIPKYLADYPDVQFRAAEAFSDLDEDVRQSIARIKASPFVPHKDDVRGFVFDVGTGKLREVK